MYTSHKWNTKTLSPQKRKSALILDKITPTNTNLVLSTLVGLLAFDHGRKISCSITCKNIPTFSLFLFSYKWISHSLYSHRILFLKFQLFCKKYRFFKEWGIWAIFPFLGQFSAGRSFFEVS